MSLGLILVTVAGLVGLAAAIWLIVVAFQNNEKGWGIALIVSLLLPISPLVILVFLVLRWGIARRPGILYLASLAVMVIGVALTIVQARQLIQEMSEKQMAFQTQGLSPGQPAPTTPEPAEAPQPARRAEPLGVQRDAPAPPPDSPVPAPAVPTEPPLPPPIAPANTATAGLDRRISPVEVDVIQLGEPAPTRMRSIDVRARNSSTKAVRELKLQLAYFDASGLRVGRWTTVHTDNSDLVAGGATNQFRLQAFFVPQFTREVRIEVEAIGFADGTRWPEVDPSLNRPGPRL